VKREQTRGLELFSGSPVESFAKTFPGRIQAVAPGRKKERELAKQEGVYAED